MVPLGNFVQKVLQLTPGHEQRLLEEDAGIDNSVERKVAEGTGGRKNSLNLFVSEKLGRDVAELSHERDSDMAVVVGIVNNKVTYANDVKVIVLHEKFSFQNTHICVYIYIITHF